MDERKIAKALIHSCKNTFWKEYFLTAPSESCKRYIALEFYYSRYKVSGREYEEFEAEKHALEAVFCRKDWAHLLKYSGHNPLKTYYRKVLQACPE